MKHVLQRCLGALLGVALFLPAVARATDVDGPDCSKAIIRDFGDAPEGYPCYPGGIIGNFPTCVAPGGIGSQSFLCPPISTMPGPTGYVMHLQGFNGYWLGPCGSMGGGIDTEPDGKSGPGGGFSICGMIPTDCPEVAFGGMMTFGQDECYGSTDAGIAAPITFTTCSPSTVTFSVFNCSLSRSAVLNILVDWNHDGDWNDNEMCGTSCVYEWAVKNAPIMIPPGCTSMTSPVFTAGSTAGPAWLRITISNTPVPDDFPWNGSASLAGGSLNGGETEDYPVDVKVPTSGPCMGSYEDFGDAPEGYPAYPGGIIGNFPTCTAPGATAVRQTACLPIDTPPGPAGFVEHMLTPAGAPYFWFGCGLAAAPGGIDTEFDGKSNPVGGGAGGVCSPTVIADCTETAFPTSMTFGQDECYGDMVDAGLMTPVQFVACSTSVVTFTTFSCATAARSVYLNVLVDWNEDGDWVDNFLCGTSCVYEWALKNVVITLPIGCGTITSPVFTAGPRPGNGWMRMTLTPGPVPDDFSWNGSASVGGFMNGETEDYPVTIRNPIIDPCAITYTDFGDAPEGFPAYPSGVLGHFPTCIAPSPPGTQEIECDTPQSSPPGTTGFVEHISGSAPIWLGCPTLGAPHIDTEPDGKTSPGGMGSFCSMLIVDCTETAFGGMSFGQDECYGDADAGIASKVSFGACTNSTVKFDATYCATVGGPPVTVFLNILVDWNQDGDWNDNILCPRVNLCAHEWAVKNALITLAPGCNSLTSPLFRVGPHVGPAWMRVSISTNLAPPDFPWNGTVSMGSFKGGETEDYPVEIVPSLIGVGDEGLPQQVALGVSPNPSSDWTNIRYALPEEARADLAVYDIAGRLLKRLHTGQQAAGEYFEPWNFRTQDGIEVPAGVYLVRLDVMGKVYTRTVIRVH